MAYPDARKDARGGAREPRRYTLTEAGYAALAADEATIVAGVRHPRARTRWTVTDAGRAALDADEQSTS